MSESTEESQQAVCNCASHWLDHGPFECPSHGQVWPPGVTADPNIAELREQLKGPGWQLSDSELAIVFALLDRIEKLEGVKGAMEIAAANSCSVITDDYLAQLEAIEAAAVNVVEGWNICLSVMDDDNQIPGNAWNDFNADFEDLCVALDAAKEWRTGK